MKHFLSLAILCLLAGLSGYAQQGEVIGTVINTEESNATIPFVNVMYADGRGTSSDFDGNFKLTLPYGTYTLTLSATGLTTKTVDIVVDRKKLVLGTIGMAPNVIVMKEADVIADMVEKDDPFTATTIDPKQVEQELGGGADLPMVLNSTPSVYATQSGGGDGDARITIRGFSQNNIAVMLDGVPVNDMENGWVYWSNWSGLDVVLRSTQVQRGLSASKIAIPAVGGSMNILTKGVEAKREITLRQEVTDFGYRRTTIGLTTGKSKSGWGATFAGSRKWGSSWADGTFTDGWFYFGKVEKQFGKHLISLSAMGAPQKHGQRSFGNDIALFDKDFARKMFTGSEQEYNDLLAYQEVYNQYWWQTSEQRKEANPAAWQEAVDQLAAAEEQYGYTPESFISASQQMNFIDTTGITSRGIRYNQYWGDLSRYTIENQELNSWNQIIGGDTVWAPVEQFHERVNYYHKPQFSIRDFWSVNDKLYISNVAYLSVGTGGGTGMRPSISQTELDDNGQIAVQDLIYGPNYSLGLIDTTISFTERRSSKILATSRNDHFWYGLLSTAQYEHNKQWSFSGGLDMRSYRGTHFREVYDLLGGDYFIDNIDRNQTSNVKREGDKFSYYNDAIIRWFGSFAAAQYKTGRFTTFLNVSGAYSAYYRTDYFKRKDLVIGDEVYRQAVGEGDVAYYNGTELVTAGEGATITEDNGTITIDNNDVSGLADGTISGVTQTYTNESDETRYATTDWNWFPSYTFKGGIVYSINEDQRVYVNGGYINKAPRFNNVYDNANNVYNNIQPEKIRAIEAGYSYFSKKRKFIGNVSTYYTNWLNEPVNIRLSTIGEDNAFNLNGLSSVHAGIELDALYKLLARWEFTGVASFGDWKLTQNAIALEVDRDGNPVLDANGEQNTKAVNAKGVPVGNAAQTQLVGSVRWKPFKGAYIKAQVTYFARNYANWNPADYDPDTKNTIGEPLGFYADGSPIFPWQVPNYYLLDAFAGYGFKWKQTRISFNIKVNNVLNLTYISDATNNDGFKFYEPKQRFDAASASVFFGQGRRLSTSLKISF